MKTQACTCGSVVPHHFPKCPDCSTELPIPPAPPPPPPPPPPSAPLPIVYEPEPARGEWEGVSLKERCDIIEKRYAGGTRALLAKYFREAAGL